MALIIPPGFCQAVFVQQLTGDAEPIVNTMGFDISDSGLSAENVANMLQDVWTDNMVGILPSIMSMVLTTIYIGQDGGPPVVADSTTPPVAGGASGTGVLPQNCAMLVRKRTDLAGRRGRGRWYIAGVPEGSVDALGVITGSHVSGVQGVMDDLMASWAAPPVGGPVIPVVLHRSEGAGTEPAPTPIQTLVVDNKLATQRRRLRP